MRQILVAGLSFIVISATGDRASAEIVGFLTNELVQQWNSPNSTSQWKKARSRRGSRVQRRKRERTRTGGRVRGSLTGIASYYWQSQRVASGGWFNPNALTAAHKTLRFGTRVRVTHLGNGRSVVVRINDRGPYIRGRIIDLSKRAAGVIRMRGSGVARVRVDVLGR